MLRNNTVVRITGYSPTQRRIALGFGIGVTVWAPARRLPLRGGKQQKGENVRSSWLAVAAAALLTLSCQGAQGTGDTQAPDAANATYTIDGQAVRLSNGSAERAAAPGSATKIRTSLSDKRAVGDVNGDRKSDVAVILTHDPGGSGTFSLLATVLADSQGKATNTVLLGDRVVVENLGIANGQITVEYLSRRDNEPMAAPPSVKTAKRFAVKDGKLGEVK